MIRILQSYSIMEPGVQQGNRKYPKCVLQTMIFEHIKKYNIKELLVDQKRLYLRFLS